MYSKPIVLTHSDMAEGVYAASGAATCWSGSCPSVQNWNGSHNVFEVRISHSADVQHISNAVTITIQFNSPLTDVYAENGWSCTANGSTVTVTRPSHANAYNSGDNVTFKIWAKAADETTTKALYANITGFSCDYSANVQGNGGDGN
ncbi:MAG: hypothetical protein E7427_01915 [Ruminococcaceae bacterium]|nr:hypothetical protein [Oscillospiraceae bacterium]